MFAVVRQNEYGKEYIHVPEEYLAEFEFRWECFRSHLEELGRLLSFHEHEKVSDDLLALPLNVEFSEEELMQVIAESLEKYSKMICSQSRMKQIHRTADCST